MIIIVTISINFQLFEALIDFGENWDDHSLALLAGGNLLRVLRQVYIDDDHDDDCDDDDLVPFQHLIQFSPHPQPYHIQISFFSKYYVPMYQQVLSSLDHAMKHSFGHLQICSFLFHDNFTNPSQFTISLLIN